MTHDFADCIGGCWPHERGDIRGIPERQSVPHVNIQSLRQRCVDCAVLGSFFDKELEAHVPGERRRDHGIFQCFVG